MAGDLIQVAADPAVLGGQLAKGRQQFIVDRVNGDDGFDRRTGDRLANELGLIHAIQFDAAQKFFILCIVQSCFYEVGAFWGVVGF